MDEFPITSTNPKEEGRKLLKILNRLFEPNNFIILLFIIIFVLILSLIGVNNYYGTRCNCGQLVDIERMMDNLSKEP